MQMLANILRVVIDLASLQKLPHFLNLFQSHSTYLTVSLQSLISFDGRSMRSMSERATSAADIHRTQCALAKRQGNTYTRLTKCKVEQKPSLNVVSLLSLTHQ